MPGSWHREGGAGASAATSCSAGSWPRQPKREGRLVLGTGKAASAPRRRLLGFRSRNRRRRAADSRLGRRRRRRRRRLAAASFSQLPPAGAAGGGSGRFLAPAAQNAAAAAASWPPRQEAAAEKAIEEGGDYSWRQIALRIFGGNSGIRRRRPEREGRLGEREI
uniref:Uncharacterized protein n=1 Tax=Oryza nivara TaxID=4536 RepID=A0A0E0FWY3_ORYNI